MIINNTHIQGIFKYSDDFEFERGDFIILDSLLYICTAEFPTDTELQLVKGQNPSLHPENFKIYLGDKITSVDEYFNYIDDPANSEDKYVSSHAISGILNRYMFGLNERGIISEYILYNTRNQSMSFSPGLSERLSDKTFRDGVLSYILREDDLNNALIKISPDLPEVKNLFGSSLVEGENNIILLRQYTYNSFPAPETTTTTTYRVQELIYPLKGIVFYRCTQGFGYDSISSWKSSFYDTNAKTNLDNLFNYYQNLNDKLTQEKENLKNRFCYSSIRINRSNSVTIQCNNPSGIGYLDVPSGSFSKGSETEVYNSGLKDRLILDIVTRRKVSNMWNSSSITIDLMDSLITNNPITEYNVGANSSILLRVNVVDNNTITLTVEPTSTTVITCIYYRKYYDE